MQRRDLEEYHEAAATAGLHSLLTRWPFFVVVGWEPLIPRKPEIGWQWRSIALARANAVFSLLLNKESDLGARQLKDSPVILQPSLAAWWTDCSRQGQ